MSESLFTCKKIDFEPFGQPNYEISKNMDKVMGTNYTYSDPFLTFKFLLLVSLRGPR